MLDLLKKHSNVCAILAIVILGTFVFSSGLSNPFMGDDIPQIVDNIPVHSVSNIPLFFRGSTFYNGQGLSPLDGVFYRPLMMTGFSAIYTIFGANSLPFHILQIGLHIGSAVLVFLVLRYFIRQEISFALSIIFLVHPINSQAVFSIPALQEPLFMFFGLLGMWTLIRFQDRSRWYLLLTVACLLLSLFAKETAILFAIIMVMYTALADKKRFMPLLLLSVLSIAAYLLLRENAVGPFTNPHVAPIDELNIWGRLINIPAITLFYFAKFLLPIGLAQTYYWHIGSYADFFLPLALLATILLAYLRIGFALRSLSDKRPLILFVLFGAWLAVGLGLHLQIVPLDATANEAWFYFPIVGLLGVLGVLYDTFGSKSPNRVIIWLGIIYILLLASRTYTRGFDWSDQTNMAKINLSVSKEDYISENQIANSFVRNGKYQEAKNHVERSIKLYPTFTNYNTLGLVLIGQGDYPGAKAAWLKSIQYGGDQVGPYTNLVALTMVYGELDENGRFAVSVVKKFPKNADIWFFIAILASRHNDNEKAKYSIAQAEKYGHHDTYIYNKIMNNESFVYNLDTRPRE